MDNTSQFIRKMVRPFIAVSFILATVGLFAWGKLDAREILTPTGIIIGFYFGERAALKKPEDKDN